LHQTFIISRLSLAFHAKYSTPIIKNGVVDDNAHRIGKPLQYQFGLLHEHLVVDHWLVLPIQVGSASHTALGWTGPIAV
jgi:hypothetical protein